MNSPHPLSPRAIPLISHQDVIPSGWHQISVVVVEMIFCRYPLQYEDRTFCQPKSNWKIIFHQSIHYWAQKLFFFFVDISLDLTMPFERWAKWFTPSCWPSKTFPSVWPSIHKAPRNADSVKKKTWKKWKKQNNKTGAIRNNGGLFLDEICWAIFWEVWRGWGQEMVALSGGYIRKSRKWRWIGSKSKLEAIEKGVRNSMCNWWRAPTLSWSRWWQLKYVYFSLFHPLFGEDEPNLTIYNIIFKMGWFNHPPCIVIDFPKTFSGTFWPTSRLPSAIEMRGGLYRSRGWAGNLDWFGGMVWGWFPPQKNYIHIKLSFKKGT